MTLLWLDGFEQFAIGTGHLSPPYTYSGAISGSAVNRRVGSVSGDGKEIRLTEGSIGLSSSNYTHILSNTDHMGGSTDPTWVVGFRTRFFRQDFEPVNFIAFTHDGSSMLTLRLQSGTVTVRRGNYSGTFIASANVNLATTVWRYMEFKVLFDTGTSGTLEMYMDGEQVMNETGLRTTNTSDVYPTHIGVAGAARNASHDFDDYYICDGSGATHNDFLGPGAIKRLMAEANGTTNDFSLFPNTGETNYENVDDDDPDDDTTYNYSGTSTDKDLYEVEDCPSTPASIEGVSVITRGIKTDAGAIGVNHVVSYDDGGGAAEDTDAITPLETYGHLYSIFPADPNGDPWAETSVNAMEVGVEIT